jgi:hypothetical protein
MIPRGFREVWFLDTEFMPHEGDQPHPICLVGKEHFSGRVVQQWLWHESTPKPLFPTGPDVLVICYSAPAEWSVYLALNWPLPVRIVDLHVEYRWLLSGFKQPSYSQLTAMQSFGLPCMDEFFKSDMRAQCIRGGPYDLAEMREILAYCEADVDGLALLFAAMERHIQWPQALARGRYTAAVARMETLGVPIDQQTYVQFRQHRQAIREALIEEKASSYGIYDGDSFDTDGFKTYLTEREIPWPLTPTGRLSTREEVFEELVDEYPCLRPLYEVQSALNKLKDDAGLPVGQDGRARTSLRPFTTKTGRNAPSGTQFIMGKSIAFRSLVKPDPGWAVAYLDWSQQEFAIAAVLSDDHNMRQAYLSGDPYLEFAKQAGAVRSSATRASHPEARELFKQCLLAVNYGQGAFGLSKRLRQPIAYARELLSYHRQVYRRYWHWAEMVQNQAMLANQLYTVFGWRVGVGRNANWRSLRNFPCQANGSEMLRLACCLATERGFRVIAPVHDALLIEAPEKDIGSAVTGVQTAMAEASAAVLNGFTLRTDATVVKYPARYRDVRGTRFWDFLVSLLAKVRDRESPCTP